MQPSKGENAVARMLDIAEKTIPAPQIREKSTTRKDRKAAFEAVESIRTALPALPKSTAELLALLIGDTLAEECTYPITPFRTSPKSMFGVLDPDGVLKYLLSIGAKVPSNGREIDPTPTALSRLGNLTSGTLSSIRSGRMGFTADTLEKWRTVLYQVGKYNTANGVEGCEVLASFEDPRVMFEQILGDYADLQVRFSFQNFSQWAGLHLGMSVSEVGQYVQQARPTAGNYMRSMVNIWRAQYEEGTVPTYEGCKNFSEVLKTYTTSKAGRRGGNRMVELVHTGMKRFNARVKYPSASFQTLCSRFDRVGEETGLTADILLAYCVYTGANPLGIMHWIAKYASENQGHFQTFSRDGYTPRDIMAWYGLMSPWEFWRFVRIVGLIGVVSDQEVWTLLAYHPSYIYSMVPSRERAEADLAISYENYADAVDRLFEKNFTDDPVEAVVPSGRKIHTDKVPFLSLVKRSTPCRSGGNNYLALISMMTIGMNGKAFDISEMSAEAALGEAVKQVGGLTGGNCAEPDWQVEGEREGATYAGFDVQNIHYLAEYLFYGAAKLDGALMPERQVEEY